MAQPVILDWSDLASGKDLTAEVEKAFGDRGLGLCVVRGVPGLAEVRQRLLPLARELARLPTEVLAKYELEETLYQTGWSLGREKFQGKPDLAKGSFYANPIFDDPADGNDAMREKYPWAAWNNVWPEEVPALEAAFKDVGRLVYETAKPIVEQCDLLIDAKHGNGSGRLFDITFNKSRLALGRLLHYYAIPSGSSGATSSEPGEWCGWHNDNSTITGLVPAMWFNDLTGEEAPASKTAGLFVKGRHGEIERVRMPIDCLGFQIGEAAQIISGGILKATPHQVRGHQASVCEPALTRETFALFIEPNWDYHIGPPKGVQYDRVLEGEETVLIPPLSQRLHLDASTNTVEFGKLLGDSFQVYYAHNNPATITSCKDDASGYVSPRGNSELPRAVPQTPSTVVSEDEAS
jgi:isopenicillin N synthase-like dioxygenase